MGLPSPVVPCEAPDWRLLYEQQRVRADALQARVKELTWAETSARSHAGMLKWHLARTRAQLEAAHGEVKEVRRDAQQSLFFKSQVARLEALLEEAGVETSRRSTMMSLRQDVFRLKKDLKAATAWHREVASLKRATVRQGETIKELRARCAEQEADLARLRGHAVEGGLRQQKREAEEGGDREEARPATRSVGPRPLNGISLVIRHHFLNGTDPFRANSFAPGPGFAGSGRYARHPDPLAAGLHRLPGI